MNFSQLFNKTEPIPELDEKGKFEKRLAEQRASFEQRQAVVKSLTPSLSEQRNDIVRQSTLEARCASDALGSKRYTVMIETEELSALYDSGLSFMPAASEAHYEFGRRKRDAGHPCPAEFSNPANDYNGHNRRMREGWLARDAELVLWRRMFCA